MPRMTDLLTKCTGQAKRKRDEDQGHFLRRITHLYCGEKGIERIEGLSVCRSLSVLYLYDNFISIIENLAPCQLLTHLYLQNNNITRMANLSSLPRLSKLYLGCNAVTVVEGLEGLKHLSELHIAHQRIPEGEQLLFDPRSLSAAAGSLTVLNVSGNNLDSLSDLQCLRELSFFSACDNHLSNMKDLSRVFAKWHLLRKLELAGNPLCQKYKYKDRVITMGSSITSLDGREVNQTERLFLMRWKAMRKARRNKSTLLNDITLMNDIHHNGFSSNPCIASTKHVLLSASVCPLTLPALPVSVLPRKSKKRFEQDQAITTTFQFPDHFNHYGSVSGIQEEPEELGHAELASYQSIAVHPGKLLTNFQGDYLQRTPWRTSQNTTARLLG